MDRPLLEVVGDDFMAAIADHIAERHEADVLADDVGRSVGHRDTRGPGMEGVREVSGGFVRAIDDAAQRRPAGHAVLAVERGALDIIGSVFETPPTAAGIRDGVGGTPDKAVLSTAVA